VDIIHSSYYKYGSWRDRNNFCCFICVNCGPYTLLKTTVFSIYTCSFSTEFILHMYIIAQTYLRFCETKRKSYWNTTSGFEFLVNRTIGGILMTSLKFSRWRPLTSQINFRFLFDLRRSVSVSIPNSVKISRSTAELWLLPVSENERPPYWNSTSVFDFNLLIVIGISFCVGLPNFM